MSEEYTNETAADDDNEIRNLILEAEANEVWLEEPIEEENVDS